MSGTRYVYAIQAGSRFKVGWSSDPERRRRDLQTGQPETLVIAAVWPDPDATKIERLMHSILDPYRVRGEWFECPIETVIAAWGRVQDARPTKRGWAAWQERAVEMGLAPIPARNWSYPADRPSPVRVLGLPLGTTVEHVGHWAFDPSEEVETRRLLNTWPGFSDHRSDDGTCRQCGRNADDTDRVEPMYLYGWLLGDGYQTGSICAACAGRGSWPIHPLIATEAGRAAAEWTQALELIETDIQFSQWVSDHDEDGQLYLLFSNEINQYYPFLASLYEQGRKRGHLTDAQVGALWRWWVPLRDKWAADWEIPERHQGATVTKILFECVFNAGGHIYPPEHVAACIAWVEWQEAGHPWDARPAPPWPTWATAPVGGAVGA